MGADFCAVLAKEVAESFPLLGSTRARGESPFFLTYPRQVEFDDNDDNETHRLDMLLIINFSISRFYKFRRSKFRAALTAEVLFDDVKSEKSLDKSSYKARKVTPKIPAKCVRIKRTCS